MPNKLVYQKGITYFKVGTAHHQLVLTTPIKPLATVNFGYAIAILSAANLPLMQEVLFLMTQMCQHFCHHWKLSLFTKIKAFDFLHNVGVGLISINIIRYPTGSNTPTNHIH